MINLMYHNITKEDMNNGDGLRTVLWVAGCEHHCPECQNPVTWDRCGGIPFDEAANAELMESLKPNYISGITFSGGDPLATYNRAAIAGIIANIKKEMPEKTIWVYSGYTWEQLIEQANEDDAQNLRFILLNADVLIDGRYEKDKRDITLKWRGSKNQRVLDVQKTLKAKEPVLHCD